MSMFISSESSESISNANRNVKSQNYRIASSERVPEKEVEIELISD